MSSYLYCFAAGGVFASCIACFIDGHIVLGIVMLFIIALFLILTYLDC